MPIDVLMLHNFQIIKLKNNSSNTISSTKEELKIYIPVEITLQNF